MKRVTLILGGIAGPDGFFDSAGMLLLVPQLNKIGCAVQILPWTEWQNTAPDTRVVIGFSGGGSRATYLRRPYDLLVLYDPSPAWQMQPIYQGVKRCLCYHNTAPDMYVPFIGHLGGGVAVGHQVETIDIAEQHLLVQADLHLHARTIEAVKALT